MGRNYLTGCDGDRINTVLAAAGYNFSLLLRWFEELLRVHSLILCHTLLAAPLHLTRVPQNFLHDSVIPPTSPEAAGRLLCLSLVLRALDRGQGPRSFGVLAGALRLLRRQPRKLQRPACGSSRRTCA
jgi:hypothetical protein